MSELWPWAALIGLGAFHGLNPAMGWLFAVGLGLQRGERMAVVAALPPIALGHAAAIALAVALVGLLRLAADTAVLRLLAAGCLIGFGLYRLLRGYRHTVRVGMRAGFADLTLWSFLMATAHGAGLMVVPVLLQMPNGARAGHAASMAAFGGSLETGLLAVGLHTAAMLATAGAIAWLVYSWVGLAVLRRAWINVDLIWSAVLIAVGALFLVAAAADLGAPAPPHHAH